YNKTTVIRSLKLSTKSPEHFNILLANGRGEHCKLPKLAESKQFFPEYLSPEDHV
ncbi:hypothetical protein BGZ65_005841, partial [Modicella reniformis]